MVTRNHLRQENIQPHVFCPSIELCKCDCCQNVHTSEFSKCSGKQRMKPDPTELAFKGHDNMGTGPWSS